MKTRLSLLILMALLLTACSHNDEPESFESYPIVQSFIPQTLYLNDFFNLPKDQRARYTSGTYIINSLDELPQNEFFSNSIYKNARIDFSNTTLLISVALIPDEISGYGYRWGYNHFDNRTQFVSAFNRTFSDNDDEATYVMTAILVRKLPPDLEVDFVTTY